MFTILKVVSVALKSLTMSMFARPEVGILLSCLMTKMEIYVS